MSTHTIYPLAALGGAHSGLTGTLGYRLLNVDGTESQAFTTLNVAETSVPGNYTITTGVVINDLFNGRIEWGTASTKLAEEVFATPYVQLTQAGFNAVHTDGPFNIAQALNYIMAACFGKVAGAGTGTEIFYGINTSIPRITVSDDVNGNRTNILLQ
jgi:hypothetical protein